MGALIILFHTFFELRLEFNYLTMYRHQYKHTNIHRQMTSPSMINKVYAVFIVINDYLWCYQTGRIVNRSHCVMYKFPKSEQVPKDFGAFF